ncbi:MAG: sel1 repeat family protein [Synergistaceae bacterium]|nr:sel1 repeat family protein [Synergistaceae bacterium]
MKEIIIAVLATAMIMLIKDYWLQIKAMLGIRDAQYQLGRNFRKGINGVRPDRKEAFYWLEKAAKKGHNNAQCNIGFMKLNGEGCE